MDSDYNWNKPEALPTWGSFRKLYDLPEASVKKQTPKQDKKHPSFSSLRNGRWRVKWLITTKLEDVVQCESQMDQNSRIGYRYFPSCRKCLMPAMPHPWNSHWDGVLHIRKSQHREGAGGSLYEHSEFFFSPIQQSGRWHHHQWTEWIAPEGILY